MQKDFLYVLASLAARSQDPLAREVLKIARANAIMPVEVEGFQEFPGRGLGGLVRLPNENRPRAVVVGTRPFIQECGLDMPAILESAARKWEKEKGAIVILAGWDAWVRGVLKYLPAGSP